MTVKFSERPRVRAWRRRRRLAMAWKVPDQMRPAPTFCGLGPAAGGEGGGGGVGGGVGVAGAGAGGGGGGGWGGGRGGLGLLGVEGGEEGRVHAGFGKCWGGCNPAGLKCNPVGTADERG